MLFHAGVSNALTSAALALAVACLARPLSRRPAVLHGLWLLVLLKLITPPLYEVALPGLPALGAEPAPRPAALAIEQPAAVFSVAVSETFPSDQSIDMGDGLDVALFPTALPIEFERAAAVPMKPTSEVDWLRMLMAIWLCGSAVVLIVSCLRVRRFQRWLGLARPVPDEIQLLVDGWAERMGLRRNRTPVAVWADGRFSPMVWPLARRPRVVVPRGLWKTLDDRQRAAVVVHELAHLRRGDHWARFLELIVTALYWWDPVVWLARHALRDVEERCCDAWALWALPDAARAYAESLLEALDFLSQPDHAEPLLACGFGKVHHLRRRLIMIMSGTSSRLLGMPGALGVLGLAATLLPLSASWAQNPEKPAADTVAARSARPDLALAKVEKGDKGNKHRDRDKHEADDAESDESDTKEIKFHVVAGRKLTDEEKAEVKKLEARIKKLHEGLFESQKKLMEAYGELAKLKGFPRFGGMGGMGMSGGMMPGGMMGGMGGMRMGGGMMPGGKMGGMGGMNMGGGMMPGGMGAGMMPGGMMGEGPGAMMWQGGLPHGPKGRFGPGVGNGKGMAPTFTVPGFPGGADKARSFKPGAFPGGGSGPQAFTFMAVPSNRKDEQRIDKLEKTLEKVLKELEGLKHGSSND